MLESSWLTIRPKLAYEAGETNFKCTQSSVGKEGAEVQRQTIDQRK